MKIIGCKIVIPIIALQEAHNFILTSLSCQLGHKVSHLVSPIVNFKIVINTENILCIQYIHLLSHNENTPYNFGICTLNIIRMRIEYIYHFSHNVHTPYNFGICKLNNMRMKIHTSRAEENQCNSRDDNI